MNAETLALGHAEPRIPKVVLRAVASLAVLLAIAVLAAQIEPYLNRPIETVRIEGHFQHLTAVQLAAAADVGSGEHLFDADLVAVRTRVEALPWVAGARVMRVWPDALAISVREREPVARWGDDGLLDRDGNPFRPSSSDLDVALPQLAGPDDRADEVLDTYKRLSAALSSGLFALAGLTLDERGEWTATTRSKVVLRLGQDDPLAQIALIQGAVTDSLAQQMDAVAYVDLRYPNGFAVGWVNGKDIEHCATKAGSAGGSPFCGRLSASVSGGASAPVPATHGGSR